MKSYAETANALIQFAKANGNDCVTNIAGVEYSIVSVEEKNGIVFFSLHTHPEAFADIADLQIPFDVRHCTSFISIVAENAMKDLDEGIYIQI